MISLGRYAYLQQLEIGIVAQAKGLFGVCPPRVFGVPSLTCRSSAYRKLQERALA
jgi:hypothetical protein